MEWMLFRGNSLTYIIIGGVLDFYFFAGGASPLSVVDQYTQLVGRPAPMPSWALENEEELMEAKTENEEELIEAEAENRAMRSRWRNPRYLYLFTIENLVKMEENFFRVPINLYAKAMSELHGFMHSDEYKQRTEQLEEFIYFVSYHHVYYYYRGKTSDDDGGKKG
ncbi:alpha-glucosidase-like [Papaver somniferum]|uniref:alpha-glucosidase-like n=1 Tax=Papaver somniferum TaxID=3469 RepID=UPI000E6FF780|nr:alpha-glucosidase-like [Papaver somniferum]